MKRNDSLKFFNALTVVLLPVDPTSKLVKDAFPSNAESDSSHSGKFGGIHIEKKTDSAGLISWDKDLVKAVIIDGQHRFTAIKLAVDDPQFPWKEGLMESQLPILLIVPDPRAGFSLPDGESRSVVETCRKIFIDLNKNAKEIPLQRELLLDDADVSAVCTRAIIEEEPTRDTSIKTCVHRILTGDALPLALVDWQSDSPKFDTGIYLTTLLTLNELVKTSLAPFEDIGSTSDYDSARDKLDGLYSTLGSGVGVEKLKEGLKKRVDKAEDNQRPFSVPQSIVKEIGDVYRHGTGRLITHFFAHFEPYSSLMTSMEDQDVLLGRFETWASLDEVGRKAFLQAISAEGDDPAERVNSAAKKVKAKHFLAFQVVFQRAAISAVTWLFKYRIEISGSFPQLVALDHGGTAKWFAVELNTKILDSLEKPHDQSSFWMGSAFAPNLNLKWTQAARRAITAATLFGLLAPVDAWNSENDARGWLSQFTGTKKKGTPEYRDALALQWAPWRAGLIDFEKTLHRTIGQPIPTQAKLEKLAHDRAVRNLYSLKKQVSDS